MSTQNDRMVLNCILNPLLPMETVEQEESDTETDASNSVPGAETSKKLEIEGVKAAEAKDYETALTLLTEAIAACPQRASSYNNRAQTLRLMGDIDGALQDLNKAIELSVGQRKAACQAYTQRAMVARLQGRDEDAKSDFEQAAELGSTFAKTQLVAMNPYAAMCNKMLNDVIGKLQRGEPTDIDNDKAA